MQKNSVAIPRESLPAPLRHISPLKHCGHPVMSFVKGGEHASSVQQAEHCAHRNGNDKEVKWVLKNILRKDESDVCEPLQSLLLWYPVACRVAAGWVYTILRYTVHWGLLHSSSHFLVMLAPSRHVTPVTSALDTKGTVLPRKAYV